MATLHETILRPIVTEKALNQKEGARTLCFEVAVDATKTDIRAAVQKLFKVKVAEVRTSTTAGKLRRRGKFAAYKGDWKKALVKLKPGEKVPEYTEL
jgi:large subunit ribosomal protein L23